MIRFTLPVLALLILMSGGCASRPPAQTLPQAWLKPGVQVKLPAPVLAVPVSQQQLLTATVNGKQQSLLVLLNADGNSLQLAGLSPLGIRLFKVVYDQTGIHTEQAIKIEGLPPANQVLADIMFSYWPVGSWQPLLPPGWTLKDQPLRRTLSDDKGNAITRIDYLPEGKSRRPVSITQMAFHYQITIQNVGE
ncbi:DUF3261 domain-containing protein [Rahnella contaminans]|uniref:DUF3261 domain-containing protein n=1 Tax=Rahnella contaminans TaxID=2703882 RepID=UPI001265DC46|nr:DUF3261 domain-containing protein [Rahnella contaminans]KAB8311450.1 DUF3261 domain-containing protein [Rouxiella chamberiensis]MDF1896964.1 DUF3261 domain-containing protein [Rahnella contaminans]